MGLSWYYNDQKFKCRSSILITMIMREPVGIMAVDQMQLNYVRHNEWHYPFRIRGW